MTTLIATADVTVGARTYHAGSSIVVSDAQARHLVAQSGGKLIVQQSDRSSARQDKSFHMEGAVIGA